MGTLRTFNRELAGANAAAGQLVRATRAFGYGDLQLEANEVTALQGLPNDGRMLAAGLFVPVTGKPFECLKRCGKLFAHPEHVHTHKRRCLSLLPDDNDAA